jgi:hypothetical protein
VITQRPTTPAATCNRARDCTTWTFARRTRLVAHRHTRRITKKLGARRGPRRSGRVQLGTGGQASAACGKSAFACCCPASPSEKENARITRPLQSPADPGPPPRSSYHQLLLGSGPSQCWCSAPYGTRTRTSGSNLLLWSRLDSKWHGTDLTWRRDLFARIKFVTTKPFVSNSRQVGEEQEGIEEE